MKVKIFLIISLLIIFNNNNINTVSSNYCEDNIKKTYKESEIVDYLYYCFMNRKDVVVLYYDKMNLSILESIIQKVFLIDDPKTIYDAEGLWGLMESYEVSIVPRLLDKEYYIFIKFNYKYSVSEMELINTWLDKTILILQNKYNINIKPDKDKAKIVHDYLINEFNYDIELKNIDDYNGISTGKMVCQGYALLYCKIMNLLNVKCKIVFSDQHSWNVVKIENKWYQVDVSGDDLGHINIKKPIYTYFLKEKLVGEKYNIIKSGIYFWNEMEIVNICNIQEIIFYKLKTYILNIFKYMFVILTMNIFLILILLIIINKKRRKYKKIFTDYMSI